MKDLIKSEALRVKPSKKHIAANTKSAKTLEKLSNDSDWNVRYGVAYNTNCPVEILAKLSKDSDWFVRRSVTYNTNCPVEILAKLSKDMDYFVQRYANQRLDKIRSAKSQAF